jgi:hypothetical protein
MNADSWRRVFDGIRPEDQATLVVRTVDQLEVAVETLSRIENEVVLIKGRVAGTADARRVFIIPYDMLATVYVNRMVAQEEVDLFSPSVSLEEKDRIAEEFAEATRRAADAVKELGNAAAGGASGYVKSQIDELKRAGDAVVVQGVPVDDPQLKGDRRDVIEQEATPTPSIAAEKRALPGPAPVKPNSRFAIPQMPKR